MANINRTSVMYNLIPVAHCKSDYISLTFLNFHLPLLFHVQYKVLQGH